MTRTLYSRPQATELDEIATALFRLYKDKGVESLEDVLGPAMTKHIRNLMEIDSMGPKLAIETTLKLYAVI